MFWLSRMLRHLIFIIAMLLLLCRTISIVLQRWQQNADSSEEKKLQQQQNNNEMSSESESAKKKLIHKAQLSTQDHHDQEGELEGELVSCLLHLCLVVSLIEVYPLIHYD